MSKENPIDQKLTSSTAVIFEELNTNNQNWNNDPLWREIVNVPTLPRNDIITPLLPQNDQRDPIIESEAEDIIRRQIFERANANLQNNNTFAQVRHTTNTGLQHYSLFSTPTSHSNTSTTSTNNETKYSTPTQANRTQVSLNAPLRGEQENRVVNNYDSNSAMNDNGLNHS